MVIEMIVTRGIIVGIILMNFPRFNARTSGSLFLLLWLMVL